MCSLGIEPTTFALLMQCSTTEPQEHLEERRILNFVMIVRHLSSRDSQIYSKIMFTHNTSALKICPNFFACIFPFYFLIFPILSYQNACYGCENTENWTWSTFFLDGQKFWRQNANVIDRTWGRIYFLTCENFGRKHHSSSPPFADLFFSLFQYHIASERHLFSINEGNNHKVENKSIR